MRLRLSSFLAVAAAVAGLCGNVTAQEYVRVRTCSPDGKSCSYTLVPVSVAVPQLTHSVPPPQYPVGPGWYGPPEWNAATPPVDPWARPDGYKAVGPYHGKNAAGYPCDCNSGTGCSCTQYICPTVSGFGSGDCPVTHEVGPNYGHGYIVPSPAPLQQSTYYSYSTGDCSSYSAPVQQTGRRKLFGGRLRGLFGGCCGN